MIRILCFLALLPAICGNLSAQNFTIAKSGIFTPQQKKVLLVNDTSSDKNLILFKTSLQVNTDGAPLSYHPLDLRGREKALNNICNAVAIRRIGSNKNLCLSSFGEAISVFEQFRDSKYEVVPAGFSITWENVLIPEVVNGRKVPCVLKTGEYAGYFASATSLKNGLQSDKGECQCKDQVNPLKVPGLVLVGGNNNILRQFGAKLGDLVLAYNPKNKNLVFAIINDFGPPNNLGEGSVLLNMKLLGDTTFPKNRKETFRYSISSGIVIAVIPNSKSFHEVKPFTAENIIERGERWLRESGFATNEDYINFLEESMMAKLD
jgi:hypothetical protein